MEFRSSCPHCETLMMVNAADLVLFLGPSSAEKSAVVYWCPACSMNVRRPVTDASAEVLLAWAGHAEVIPLEALEPHAGPPISVADARDLAVDLADWGLDECV